MTTQSLIPMRDTITDLKAYLNTKSPSEGEMRRLFTNRTEASLNSFQELLSSVIDASNTYMKTYTSVVLGVDTRYMEDEDSKEAIALPYILNLVERTEYLYELRKEKVESVMALAKANTGLYHSLIRKQGAIESLLSDKSARSTSSIISHLSMCVSSDSVPSFEIQKVIYSLKHIREEVSGLYYLLKVKMFEDLGFKETFIFLCNKATSAGDK